MTTSTETAGARDASPDAAAPVAGDAPLVHLGLRRGWWVVLCVLLLVAVDLLPTVGPYLSLVVLLWMVDGLARARPRAATPQRRTHAGRLRRRRRAEPGAALPAP